MSEDENSTTKALELGEPAEPTSTFACRRCSTASGTVLDGPTLASLVCHSVLQRVLMAGSVLLDYGTATRSIAANLFNALMVRDRPCRFPGCDRPAEWADAHHVVHVEDGGTTCASNCVLLCRRHHTRLHRKGWSRS